METNVQRLSRELQNLRVPARQERRRRGAVDFRAALEGKPRSEEEQAPEPEARASRPEGAQDDEPGGLLDVVG